MTNYLSTFGLSAIFIAVLLGIILVVKNQKIKKCHIVKLLLVGFLGAILIVESNTNFFGNIYGSVNFYVEQIGIEFEYLGETRPERADSHGWAKGFSQTINGNEWNVSFDKMHSTTFAEMNYHTGQNLQVQSTVESDKVWIKITDYKNWKIQKVPVKCGDNKTIGLSDFKPGKLLIWLVADSDEGGTINVKADEFIMN